MIHISNFLYWDMHNLPFLHGTHSKSCNHSLHLQRDHLLHTDTHLPGQQLQALQRAGDAGQLLDKLQGNQDLKKLQGNRVLGKEMCSNVLLLQIWMKLQMKIVI